MAQSHGAENIPPRANRVNSGLRDGGADVSSDAHGELRPNTSDFSPPPGPLLANRNRSDLVASRYDLQLNSNEWEVSRDSRDHAPTRPVIRLGANTDSHLASSEGAANTDSHLASSDGASDNRVSSGLSRLAEPAMQSVVSVLDIDSVHKVPESMCFNVREHLLPRNNSHCSFDDMEELDWKDVLTHIDPINAAEVSSVASTFSTCMSQFTDRDANDLGLGDFALNDEQLPVATDEIYVASSKKSFNTLASALRNAKEGDVLELSPGVYVEQGVLEVKVDNIVVCASLAGSSGEVQIQLHGPLSSLVCRAKGFKARNLRLVHCGSEVQGEKSPLGSGDNNTVDGNTLDFVPACVNVVSGDAHFEACRFTGSLRHGICVWGDASPTFKLCSIDNCQDVAVVCRGNSRPSFLSNTLRKNKSFAVACLNNTAGHFVGNVIVKTAKCAVICGGQSTTIFERNTVSQGLQGAFWLQASSRCQILENTAENNLKAGLQVSNDADPIVRGNKILKGDGGGIVVHDRARGRYSNNLLQDSSRAGVGVMDLAQPVFLGNTIVGNQGGGAVLTGKSSPVFINNEFRANGFVGVGVKEESTPFFEDNKIDGNCGYGLLLQKSCEATLQRCSIVANHRAGVCVCDNAKLVMHGCRVEASCAAGGADGGGAQAVGVLLHDNAKAIVMHSTLRYHTSGNLVSTDASTLTLTSSEVSHGDYGLKMYGNATAHMRHNSFIHHVQTHILVHDHAELRASHNALIDGKGCGIRAVHTPHLALSHNQIMGNIGMGVDVKGRALVEMRANRISSNSQYGVIIHGAVCKLKANVIFGNQMEGLHLEHTSHTQVHGNCITRGSGLALVLEGSERTGIDVTHFTGNLLQLDSSSRDSLPPFFHENNVNIQTGARQVVRHSLEVLENWAQCRAGHVVIEMPDGSQCIGTPASHETKAFHLPLPKKHQDQGRDRGLRA